MVESERAADSAVAVGAERAVDVRTRVCGSCLQSMRRIEYFAEPSAVEPRVMWSCADCGTWSD
ncbi:MAG: hypothetical protein WCJ42_07790 [Actinomycetes bacterium]